MDRTSYVLDVENSFIYFLITLQKLNLSERIMSLMLRSDTILQGFVYRNKASIRKPNGVLIRWQKLLHL